MRTQSAILLGPRAEMLYFFEDFVLDPDRRELRRGNAVVAVQPQVFDLLEYLITNRDRVVSKDDILQAVWGGRIVSESALTTRINATRTAVGDDGNQQRLIRTIPRKGIRFIGAVRERPRPVDEPAAARAVIETESSDGKAASHDEAVPAERRQLTIASCELLVRTVPATVDPEDLSEIVQSYQSCIVETTRRNKGFVAHTYGNTAVIYFGYPHAHEDDPERAVRTALELAMAVAALNERTPLQIRIGIATGLVVIGDLTGSGEARERSIVGETLNLAARLQGVAEPGMVVIAESTRKLLGNLFALEDLGGKGLKGIEGRVRAFAALRSASMESRFEALHADGLNDLIGREEELELLMRRWSRAKSGDGQLVLLSGEAGIGKSRLTAALLERLAAEPHTRLRVFCSPQHSESALYPSIGQLERAAGLTLGDNQQAKLDKLDAVLAQTSTSADDAALFAEMLSIPNDGRYPALRLTPQQHRQRTLEALVSQIVALSRRKLVLMIFEDAQWIDPTSLELLSRIVERVPTLGVLLVVTFRPEFEPPWIGLPYVTTLTINRLTERQVSALIDCVVGDKLLSATLRQEIVERTDGIPLFVEEMTKALIEAESEADAHHAATAVPSPALVVPASLQASLMARLDRLGPAKEVAQIGAAIGRKFSHTLLTAVVHKPEAEQRSALERLIAAGLLFRQGVPPQATYLFKHALVRDAAYSTLLREQRRALHARIAETIENQFAEIAESRPESLARHCMEAALIEKAASLWGKAGQRSLERSALAEAVAQFTRALQQMALLSATPARRREEIKLQVGLANALMSTKGHAAAETKAAFDHARTLIERAEALGEPAEDPLLLYSVLYGFFIEKFIAFNGDAACSLAKQFLTLAEKQRATALVMIGHRLLGNSLLCMGDVAKGLAHLDRALALYDPSTHRSLATRFSQDIGVAILSWRPLALWLLGYPESAAADPDRAINAAREIGHAPTLLFALICTTYTHLCFRDYATANAQIDEGVRLAEEKGAVFLKAMAMAQRGCVLALVGNGADAVRTITAALTAYRSTGATVWTTSFLSYLALALADLGKFDDAERYIGEAMTVIETAKERWFEAEVDRIAGEITLRTFAPDAAKAEAYFQRALGVARQQQAKSWELRAAMSMARLWRDQGKRDEARDLLAPVYGWFTEGFDTLDLKEAKALLDELSS
jgi:class 3 adenylate cyclase/predicted ATPase